MGPLLEHIDSYKALMSPPAQKAFSSDPLKITIFIFGSTSHLSRSTDISLTMLRVKEFSVSGEFRVMWPILVSFSHSSISTNNSSSGILPIRFSFF